MRSVPLLALLLLFGWATACGQGRVVLGGQVTDSAGAPLRFVTVRALGTNFGAMSNSAGRFILRLPPGEYTISFSMVGYQAVRLPLIARGDSMELNAVLGEAVMRAPEVKVSAEDPAVRLMRRVLARKARQRDSLETYSYMLYTKFVAATDTLTAGRTDAPRDTTVVSIFESYSRGYFSRPDNYFNEIIQRRQTANVPPQANFVAFGTNLNAYDDYVSILGEEIATPFHPDAIDYYDFVLEKETVDSNAAHIARVRATPRGNGRKLFDGVVTIDADRLAPLAVELAPNRAVRLPFDAALTYDQRFDEVDGRFVVPTGMRIASTLRAELFWVIAPRLDVTIETVAYDYACNVPLASELFEQRRVEAAASAETFDSTYWSERMALPLRPIEVEAYDAIRRAEDAPDSVTGTSLIGQFFTDVTRQIGRLSRRPFTGLDDIIRYNRVHGAYLGAALRDDLASWLEGNASVGYGFADGHLYGSIGATIWPDSNRRIAFGANGFRTLARRDNPYVGGTGAITLLSLLTKSDYGDYYYADGAEVWAELGFGQLKFVRRDIFARPTTIRVSFRQEDQRGAGVNTNFAVFGGGRRFRDNPPIVNGRMRSVGAELNWDYNPMRRVAPFGLHLGVEAANPDLFGGDFRFTQYTAALNLRTRTLPLWRLDLRASGGFTQGKVPPQRFFSLESAFSSTAGEGVFRGMDVKEFYGDQFAAVSVEHNFGEIVPGVLRIPNIASFGIEFIALANVGWTRFTQAAMFAQRDGAPLVPPSSDVTADRLYYEAGIALNRVLIFLRLDITARFSQRDRPRFFVTIGGA